MIESKFLKYITLSIILIWGCQSEQISKANEFEKILTDTLNNDRAKWDLEQIQHYNSICREIGIRNIEDGTEELEIRVWRQISYFGMATDEEIYIIKKVDSSYKLTFYRVDCKEENYDNEEYKKWNAFSDAKVDSFTAISKTFPQFIVKGFDIEKIWKIKTQSEIVIPENIGFLDGSTTSIEIATNKKYKLIRHHLADNYFEATKNKEFKEYTEMRDTIINLFRKNKIYDSYY